MPVCHEVTVVDKRLLQIKAKQLGESLSRRLTSKVNIELRTGFFPEFLDLGTEVLELRPGCSNGVDEAISLVLPDSATSIRPPRLKLVQNASQEGAKHMSKSKC